MKIKKILKVILIVGLIIISIDQISKLLINQLIIDDFVIIPGNVFEIVKAENQGMAFGMNKHNLVNIIISVIVLVVIINYIFVQKEKMTKSVILYLSFIISGGMSNLIDRIIKGAVFDFIKIGDFPIFNIADICIVVGWLLFVVNFIKDILIEIKTDMKVK